MDTWLRSPPHTHAPQIPEDLAGGIGSITIDVPLDSVSVVAYVDNVYSDCPPLCKWVRGGDGGLLPLASCALLSLAVPRSTPAP